MKNRHIYWRYKIKEKLCIGQWCLSPLQSRHLGTYTFLPIAMSYFSESHWLSEISSYSKVILVLGKAKSHRVSNLACRGTESHGWFDVSPKNSAWDVIHEQAHCHDKAANHQLPIAAAFGIIWIVSTEECSSLTQNLVQICCHSVILNVTATQYTCLLNRVCCPHWLAQWSRHCSCMLIPVHSPQLPGYIDVA